MSYDLSKTVKPYAPAQRQDSGVMSRGPHSGLRKWTGSSASGEGIAGMLHSDYQGTVASTVTGSVMPRSPHVTQSSLGVTSSSDQVSSQGASHHHIPTSDPRVAQPQTPMIRNTDGCYNVGFPDIAAGQKLTRRYSTGSKHDSGYHPTNPMHYPQQFSQRSHVSTHVSAPFAHSQPSSLPENITLGHSAVNRFAHSDDSCNYDETESYSLNKALEYLEIIQHPQSCQVYVNHSLILECDVYVHGSTEASNYLWYKNGSPLVGEVNKCFAVNMVTTTDAGEYFCLVSDPSDKVRQQSNTAIVTVTEIPGVPEFVEDPQSVVEVAVGEAVEVCVKAIGRPPLEYTWYKNTKELLYASTAVLCIPNATRLDSGSYCCSVSNECGSVLSAPCRVRVVHKAPVRVLADQLQRSSLSDQKTSLLRGDVPRIALQPGNVTVVYGQQFTLSVKVENSDGFTRYKWYRNESPLLGRDVSHMTVHSAVSEDAGWYYCVVTNSVGFTRSATVQVEVVNIGVKSGFKQPSCDGVEKPLIVRHPLSQEVDPGLPLLLTCDASTSNGKLEYLWYFNGLSLNGENEPQYFINCFTDEDEGLYSCRVTANGASVMSDIAKVTITQDSN